jgi:hypothetical protein
MRKEFRDYLGLPIKTPMDYWIKYWEYYIERLENDRERTVGLTGPRIILEALKAEVQFHNSTKNKEFFKVQINQWKKDDDAFSRLFSKKWNDMTQSHFDDDVKIQECCSEIISKMNEGIYFDSLIECLRNAIVKTNKLNFDKKRIINRYSELLVSEFVANNFSLSEIRSLPEHSPVIICNEGREVLIAPDEYMGLKKEGFDTEKEYYMAIENSIKSRSFTERLCEMKQFFHKERGNYTVIIEVKGIQGKLDCTIDDINIYSPLVKRYIKDDNHNWLETDIEVDKRILAAIPVENCVPDSAITIACNRLRNLLELLTVYIDPTLSLSYNEEYVVVLKDGISLMSKGLPPMYKKQDERCQKIRDYHLSIKPSEISNKVETLNKMFSNNSNRGETFQILSSARYWYVKARETNISEDKLLFSWIAIEGICSIDDNAKEKIVTKRESNKTVTAKDSNKIDLIVKIAKAIIMKSMFYYEWLDYYFFFRDSVADDNFYDIPQNVISCIGLDIKGGELIPRAAFITGLPKLEKSINDEIKKNEIHNLFAFYKNRKGFNEREQQLENDIRMLYFIRNMIVHNASFPQAIIDIYARKSLYISGAIIKKLQTGYAETTMSLEELLVDISNNYDSFLLNFEKELKKIKSN